MNPLTSNLESDTAAGQPPTPRIWLLLGDKLGDNAQVERIVDSLGWPCERKHLVFKKRYAQSRPAFRATLHHVDIGASALLSSPWPDLILTSGRRPSSAALWVKKQSGGRTKLVVVGRPHRDLHDFDLVIAPPHFHLPRLPNVMKLDVPLMRINESRMATAVEEWRERFGALARPLTVLLVGGPQNPFRLDATVATELLTAASNLPDRGTLIVVTSRRTPPRVAAALSNALPPQAMLFAWTPESKGNPYLGLVGLADRFIVSGDSISMLVEIATLGKPLAIATLPLSKAPWVQLEQALGQRFREADINGSGFWPWLKQMLYKKGIVPFARDLRSFHSYLVEQGAAVKLGAPFPSHMAPLPDSLSQSVARVRALWNAASATGSDSR